MQHINITALKQFAHKLPKDSRLRVLLIYEKDEMTPQEFIEKTRVWLHLFRMEIGR